MREKEVGKTLSLLSFFPPSVCIAWTGVEGRGSFLAARWLRRESRLLPPFAASRYRRKGRGRRKTDSPG